MKDTHCLARMVSTLLQNNFVCEAQKDCAGLLGLWSPGPKHETQHGFCNHIAILTQHAHTYIHTYIHTYTQSGLMGHASGLEDQSQPKREREREKKKQERKLSKKSNKKN